MKRNSKYVGLDVHQAMTAVTVRAECGRVIARSVIETSERSIMEFFNALGGTVHVAFEEGTQAQWLYDLLSPRLDRVKASSPTYLLFRFMRAAPCFGPWLFPSSTVPAGGVLSSCVRQPYRGSICSYVQRSGEELKPRLERPVGRIIGEFVVIILGVLVALAADRWNQGRSGALRSVTITRST